MEYPKEIIATKTLYQNSDTFLYDDIQLDNDKCEHTLDPINICYLTNIRNHGSIVILEYYEKSSGYTESIFEISDKNLQYLIDFNLIGVLK